MKKHTLLFSKSDMERLGIAQPDFVYVSGDAYVDHPSFGPAIICRQLESFGWSVGLICQPDWKDPSSIAEFGEPRLGFLVSSGNMDSMVNHYTVAKKRRQTDAYSPGGEMGRRPDRAVIVYCNLIRKTFRQTPLIIGGIEASLRRLGHYDYWSDSVRRSILLDSGADLISYGMGEHSIPAIAEALDAGILVRDITYIPGTVYKTRDRELLRDALRLPDFEEIRADKKAYARSFALQYRNTDPYQAKTLYETYDGALFVVQNPPAMPLTTMELDDIYALPYTREVHPAYRAAGIPAYSEIRYSITSNRGCFGGCNFCALNFHQGRLIQTRSPESILEEARSFTKEKEFHGYIHDVGGPTADFYHPACEKQKGHGACSHRQCLFPEPCPNLNADHTAYRKLLADLRAIPGVKKVFIRSGIRFDYVLAEHSRDFLRDICRYHISGQLRVAPEHVSDEVLRLMGKPRHSVYEEFVREFEQVNRSIGKEQYLVPYLMSSHPGSTLKEAIELAVYLKKNHIRPEQVQDYYPTPGTVSTCMYYTGLDPLTMRPVKVTRNPHEKALQRALMQYWEPSNYDLAKEALLKGGRADLIGFGPDCLIPPRKISGKHTAAGKDHAGKPDKTSGSPRKNNSIHNSGSRQKNTLPHSAKTAGNRNTGRSADNAKKRTVQKHNAKKK